MKISAVFVLALTTLVSVGCDDIDDRRVESREVATNAKDVVTEAKITKDEYGSAWPFTVNQGVLAGIDTGSRMNNGEPIIAVTFTANGTTYGLNGVATATKRYAKIEDIWARETVNGFETRKSLSTIIDRGLKLGAGINVPYVAPQAVSSSAPPSTKKENPTAPVVSEQSPPPKNVISEPSLKEKALEAEQVLREREQQLGALQKSAAARVDSMPEIKSASTHVEELHKSLLQIRKNGSSADAVTASSRWNKARLALEKKRNALIEKQSDLIAAVKEVSRLREELNSLNSKLAEAQKEQARKDSVVREQQRAIERRKQQVIETLEVGAVGQLASDVRVIQVLADDTMLVGFGKYDEQILWVTGFNTSGIVDGARIALGPIKISGTRQYAPVLGGTKTVFQVEPAK